MTPRDFKSERRGFVPIEVRKAQALSAQQAALERRKKAIEQHDREHKEQQEVQNVVLLRDPSQFEAAISAIPISALGLGEQLHVSPVYRQLMDAALRAMNYHCNEVVLCWPNCNTSPVALSSLLALADCAAAPKLQVAGCEALAEPVGLKSLLFPYSRTAHRIPRAIYIDRNCIAPLQLKHQLRAGRPGENSALADYHKTLARVAKLTGRASDGREYPEFAHPCLDELVPVGLCSTAKTHLELLWRVRAKTDLRDISRTGHADDQAKAKFYIFGIHADENARAALRAIRGSPPDIAFLQLDTNGRNRLGRDWFDRARDFTSSFSNCYPNIPIIALTDDPWTFEKLRFELLSKQAQGKLRKPANSSIVLAHSSALAARDSDEIVTYNPISKCEVIAYAGRSAEILNRVRAARKAALKVHDRNTADRFGRLAGIFARCASLPGSRAQLSEFVEKELGSFQASEILGAYRPTALIRELRNSHDAWPQLARSELISLCGDLEKVWEDTDQLTPMAPLLRDLVIRFRNVSSRTVFLFQNDMLADFAAKQLANDHEIGERVLRRIDNGMLRFLDRAGLNDLQKLPKPELNYTKTLIVVAPARQALLSLLATPWLPDSLIVLGDADTVQCSVRDAQRLGSYGELKQLSDRINAFAKGGMEAVQKVAGPIVSLDKLVEPSDGFDLPANEIINLAGQLRPDQPHLRFELDNGQIIIARPGTRLVVQHSDTILPTFSEAEARIVEVGERVCALGEAFLEVARPLINITRRAIEEIREYHEIVKKRFEQLPGSSVSERLKVLVEKMGLSTVTEQRARYWVTLDEQLAAPLDDVIPHAPQDEQTFLSFMGALSVSESIAHRYWTWAVIALRVDHLRAGQSIRDAYRGILVDSYAAQSDNPERASDVRQLRAAAENFVGVVRRKLELGGTDAGT